MPLKGEARTEYMRDYMRRRRAAERAGATKPAAPDHDALEARNAALEQELAQAKARIAELEKAGTVAAAEIAALKGELQDALGFRFARFAPKPRGQTQGRETPAAAGRGTRPHHQGAQDQGAEPCVRAGCHERTQQQDCHENGRHAPRNTNRDRLGAATRSEAQRGRGGMGQSVQGVERLEKR